MAGQERESMEVIRGHIHGHYDLMDFTLASIRDS